VPEISTRHLREQPTVVMRTTIPVESIPAFLGKALEAVAQHIGRHDADFAGPPFARYIPVGDDFRAFEIEAGFPVTAAIPGSDEVEASMLPGGAAAVTTHIGPYDAMRPVYEAITQWLSENDAVAAGAAWEVYITDPAEQPDPASWKTNVIQPYRAMVPVR
jgi:effector-binding domain-containing protein